MAYRFDGSDDYVGFNLAPFSSHVFGPFTAAMFLKRNSIGNHSPLAFTNSTQTWPPYWGARFIGSTMYAYYDPYAVSSPAAFGSTSVWYLIAWTKAAAPSDQIRVHYHNGTSWSHSDMGGGGVGTANMSAIPSSARLRVGRIEDSGSGLNFFDGDMACVGIKKADSSDATVETLSRTVFSAWTGFGFDWLIGFDASLESAGVLQDQGTIGTGDEIAITGTSVVSDPPGWLGWSTAPASTFVPQIMIT